MREIIAFKMVLVGPPSEYEKSFYSMSKAATWLLSSATARSYPVTRPGRYGRYGYPGAYPDTDTTREDVEVSLPRRARGESNFNYRVGAVE